MPPKVKTLQQQAKFQAAANVTSVAFSSNSNTFVWGLEDGLIGAGSVAEGLSGALIQEPSGSETKVAVAASSNNIFAFSYGVTYPTVWRTGGMISTGNANLGSFYLNASATTAAAASSTGLYAAGFSNGTVSLFGPDAGASALSAIRNITTAQGSCIALAFSPDGQYLLTGGVQGGDGKVWTTSNGAALRTLAGGASTGISSAAYSPDGLKIATGGIDGKFRIWNAATGACEVTGNVGSKPLVAVKFTPSGKHLLTLEAGNHVELWSVGVDPPSCVARMAEGGITSADISSDGTEVVGACGNTVYVWDTKAVTGRGGRGLAEPWRIPEFAPTESSVASLLGDLGEVSYKSHGVERGKVLLFGAPGAGKSSLINMWITATQGAKVLKSAARTGQTGTTLTTTYRVYPLDGVPLDVHDVIGWDVTDDQLTKRFHEVMGPWLEGRVFDGADLSRKLQPGSDVATACDLVKDPPVAVVVVLGPDDHNNDALMDAVKQLVDHASDTMRTHVCAVLTKMDQVAEGDVPNTDPMKLFESVAVGDCVREVAEVTGIPESQIMPVVLPTTNRPGPGHRVIALDILYGVAVCADDQFAFRARAANQQHR
jgi:GTPase SAR1 family protein